MHHNEIKLAKQKRVCHQVFTLTRNDFVAVIFRGLSGMHERSLDAETKGVDEETRVHSVDWIILYIYIVWMNKQA